MHLTKVRTLVKRVRAEIDAGEGKVAELLKQAVRMIDMAAQKGVLKKETAARKISRLTKAATSAGK